MLIGTNVSLSLFLSLSLSLDLVQVFLVVLVLSPSRYFEDDEEESGSGADLPYIPAENSPTRQQMQAGGDSDSEDDPLDAFMAEVEVRRVTERRAGPMNQECPETVIYIHSQTAAAKVG